MLVVTFTTSADSSGKGFSLIYGFGNNPNGVRVSSNSSNILASLDLGYIRHPILQSEVYLSSALAVFIVFPGHTCVSPDKIRLRYSEIQLSPNYDGLYGFEFEGPSWNYREM